MISDTVFMTKYSMTRHFVRLLADVHCDWSGSSPIYRAYVNNELFAERNWIWHDSYLEEMFQIDAEPGDYHIRYELVPPHLASLRVQNIRVDHGPAHLIDSNTIRITDAIA